MRASHSQQMTTTIISVPLLSTLSHTRCLRPRAGCRGCSTCRSRWATRRRRRRWGGCHPRPGGYNTSTAAAQMPQDTARAAASPACRLAVHRPHHAQIARQKRTRECPCFNEKNLTGTYLPLVEHFFFFLEKSNTQCMDYISNIVNVQNTPQFGKETREDHLTSNKQLN